MYGHDRIQSDEKTVKPDNRNTAIKLPVDIYQVISSGEANEHL